LLGALAGLIVGSFLATILIRWPEGRSVVGGRSACDDCWVALGARELVPLLSYLAQRGRCRRCGAAIDPRHPLMEVAAAIIGVAALVAHPLPLGIATALLGWWLLILAALDAEHQWLPDALTLPLIPVGLLAGWAGLGPPLVDRVAGAAAGWAVLALMAWGYKRLRGREGLGGADPKLLAALGAWLGALQLPLVLVGAGLIGLLAVGVIRLRGGQVTGATRLPLGTLMALAAWPIWLVTAGHYSGAVQINLL
jgi:leader peptidase (prepilin peptidase)/N-methyltransferase